MDKSIFLLIWTLFLCCNLVNCNDNHFRSGYRYNQEKCEPIVVNDCKDMRYNVTKMPNYLEHRTQDEASDSMKQFMTFIKLTNCSPLLQFFLCTLHVPMCTPITSDSGQIVLPCREMCEKIQTDCTPVMEKVAHTWPERIACDKLPSVEDKSVICINPQPENPSEPGTVITNKPKGPAKTISPTTTPSTLTPPRRPILSIPSIPSDAVSSDDTCSSKYLAVDAGAPNRTCLPKCNAEIMYTSKDKRTMERIMIAFMTVCLAVSLFVLATFVISRARFRYPERPIIFISFCYLIHCVGYILRISMGFSKVACDTTRSGETHIAVEGLDNPYCVVIFLLLFYTELAASVWWLILAVAWYLAAGRKWSPEAIQAASGYFHLAAWAVPACFTIAALSMRKMTADELTGLCRVQPDASLLAFVVVPRFIFLICGGAIILAGFVSMIRIRQDLKQEGTNLRRMENLMAKLGVFSLLYVVPCACTLGCLLYQYVRWPTWQEEAKSTVCDNEGDGECALEASIPQVMVLQLEIASSLAAGSFCAVWVWGSKTVRSWKSFCCTRWKGNKKPADGRAGYHIPPEQNASKTSLSHHATDNRRLDKTRSLDGNMYTVASV